jgi:L-erythro-3,5-diaminohexanoate dehydrogenase
VAVSGVYAAVDLATRLGVDRVIEPVGALPQAAERLDPSRPPGTSELSLDVELLNLDATSHRQIRVACEADPGRMSEMIADIVSRRGKMHNPRTGSGGILVGRAAQIGARFPADGLATGDRVVSLASLSLVPLALEAVGPVDAASPQVRVRGHAVLAAGVPWVRAPDDLPLPMVLAALDVYGAPSHTRALGSPGQRVLVIGAGRAGLLAAAAARDATGSAEAVTVLDVNPDALANLAAAVPGVSAVCADATDAVGTQAALGPESFDLTVVVVDQPGCEMSAALATAPGGIVLFFSMATSFAAAALGAEGVASTARLLIGNGYAADHGTYALGLLRGDPRLRASFARLA